MLLGHGESKRSGLAGAAGDGLERFTHPLHSLDGAPRRTLGGLPPKLMPRLQVSSARAPKSVARPSARRNDEKAISLDAIRRILRALRLSARQTQVKSGLSAAQLFVLRSLQDGEATSLVELAERTMTDRTSVSAVVDRLLASKLVTRQTSAEDRRRAAIVITKLGRARLKRAPLPPTAVLMTGLDRLLPVQLRALALGLRALSEEMGLADDPAGMLFEDGLPDNSRRLVARRRTR